MARKKEKKKTSFWKDFGLGFRSYGKAFKLLFSTRMGFALFVPLVLLIVLIFGGWELRSMLKDYVNDYLMDVTTLDNANTWWKEGLSWMLQAMITIIFGVLFFLIFAYFGGYIVLMILSPVLALLSEKTEELELGTKYPFDIVQLARDIFRGIGIALRNLFLELGIMLLVVIAGYVPVIGWIASAFGWIAMFFVSSYFYGFSFLDYSLERRRLTVKESVKLIRKRKGVAVANGMIFSFVLMLPVIGVILATFFAVVSAVAASISMNEVFETEEEYKDIPQKLMAKKKELNEKN
ncbi:MAG: hypothetical protein C0594_12495 [Marinilabiliales bacterium]|nr:MAG: hypothetical protein C0594_12495 [Marinilabiliales bacterium]